MGQTLRLCERCKQSWPIEEYVPIRDVICKHCRELEKKEAIAKKEIEQARALMSEALAISDIGPNSRSPTLDEVCGRIVAKFGGLDRFVDTWYEQFHTALITRPGAVSNLQHFSQLMRLIGEAQKGKREDELASMTIQQIEQEQKRLTLDLLLQNLGDMAKQDAAGKIMDLFGLRGREAIPDFGVIDERDGSEQDAGASTGEGQAPA